ncbi:MAG TPA: mechanosensitive ion channel domain-containing protein [Thermoplasmata archaeon]|nr:mechanosensitive ion channel domain-containing protein [Thermoplasmata archaeon]
MALSLLLTDILGSAAIVAGSGAVFALLRSLIQTVARRARAQPTTVRGISDALTILWIALAAYLVVVFTGLASLFTILTISGIAGLALSLALQSTLTDMIAGVLLLNDRLIRVGDEISFGGVRGTIVRVAIRSVWIRTKDGDIAAIGNANLHSGPLVNYSAKRRLDPQLRAGEVELSAFERLVDARRRRDRTAAKEAEAQVLQAQAEAKRAETAEPNGPSGSPGAP